MDAQPPRDDSSRDAHASPAGDDPVAEDPTPDAPMSSGGGRADWMEALREVAPYLDLGWRIVGAAAVPPIAGWGVDVFFETLPWGVLVGAGLGLVSAGVQLRQVGIELEAQSKSSSSKPSSSKPQPTDASERHPDERHPDERHPDKRHPDKRQSSESDVSRAGPEL